MENLKVLLVDDDADLGKMMKFILSNEAPDMTFEYLEGGRECLEYLKDNEVDCILSDFQMPDMDGMELLHAIREKGLDVPFIFFTGQGNEQVARDAFMNGAYDYFTKEAGFAHFARIANSVEQAVKQLRAEHAKRKAERDWEKTFEAIDDVITLQDENFTIQRGNAAARKMLSTDGTDIAGKKCFEVFHGTDSPAPECPAVEMMQKGWPVVTHEVRLGDRTFEVKVCPVNEDGIFRNFVHIAKDITDRKTFETTLQGEKDKLESILANIGDGISIVDPEFRVLYQNRAHIGLIGPHVGEYCYKAYEHREDVCEDCPVAESFRDGAVHNAQRTTVSGETSRYVDITSSTLKDPVGRVTAGIEVVRDVTEKKEAADALRREKEFTDTVVNSMPGVFYVYDDQLRLVRWNRRYMEALGIGVDGPGSINALDTVSEEHRDMVAAKIREVLSEHKDTEAELMVVDVNGNKAPYLCTGSPMVSDGRTYLVGTGIDITEQLRAREAIVRSNELLSTILDSVNFGMMVVGRDRTIKKANRAALGMMGFGCESDVVGRTCHNFICPAETGKCPVLDLGMEVDLSSRVLLDRNGNRVPVLKSVSPVKLGGEEVLLETFVHMPGTSH